MVISQDPQPDSDVAEHSVVTIVVSAGAETAQVPGVLGLDVFSATQALQSAGFIVQQEQAEDPSEQYDEGQIWSQNPRRGHDRACGLGRDHPGRPGAAVDHDAPDTAARHGPARHGASRDRPTDGSADRRALSAGQRLRSGTQETGAPVRARKCPQQVVAVLGQDRLGVELHALDVELAVAQAHDHAVVGAGGDLEHVGDRVGVDDERVVAGGLERVGEPGEHAGALVVDLRGLAVHDRRRPHDVAAVDLADALVAEADARGSGTRPAKVVMTSLDRPASSGRPGPGLMSTASGARASMSSSVKASLRCTTGLGPQLTEVLDEVVDERVVVVDDEDPGCHGAHVTAARSDPGLRFV